MNKFYLLGNLVKDPELTANKEDAKKSFARLTLALPKGNDAVDFIDATAFGKVAETIAKFFRKGDRILIEGSISTFKKDGEYPRLVLNVNGFEFCERKKENKGSEPKENQVEDDDLPF